MGQEVKMDEYEGGVRTPLLHRLAEPLRGAWPWQGWHLPVYCVKEAARTALKHYCTDIRKISHGVWLWEMILYMWLFFTSILFIVFLMELTDERAAPINNSRCNRTISTHKLKKPHPDWVPIHSSCGVSDHFHDNLTECCFQDADDFCLPENVVVI